MKRFWDFTETPVWRGFWLAIALIWLVCFALPGYALAAEATSGVVPFQERVYVGGAPGGSMQVSTVTTNPVCPGSESATPGLTSVVWSGKRDLPDGSSGVSFVWSPGFTENFASSGGVVPSNDLSTSAIVYLLQVGRLLEAEYPNAFGNGVYMDNVYMNWNSQELFAMTMGTGSDEAWTQTNGTRRFRRGQFRVNLVPYACNLSQPPIRRGAAAQVMILGVLYTRNSTSEPWSGEWRLAYSRADFGTNGTPGEVRGSLPAVAVGTTLSPVWEMGGSQQIDPGFLPVDLFGDKTGAIDVASQNDVLASAAFVPYDFTIEVAAVGAKFEDTATARQAFEDVDVEPSDLTSIGGDGTDWPTGTESQWNDIVGKTDEIAGGATDGFDWLKPWAWFYDPDELSPAFWTTNGGGGGGGGAD